MAAAMKLQPGKNHDVAFWTLFCPSMMVVLLAVGGIFVFAKPPEGFHAFKTVHQAFDEYPMLSPKILPGILVGWAMMIASLLFVDLLFFRNPMNWRKFKCEYLSRNASPEVYLNCFFILFALMVVTGMVLTHVWADFDEHSTALVHYYGYNNICVVLDFPPATYVNPCFFSICVTYMYIYATRSSIRAYHLRKLGVIDAKTHVFCRLVDWKLCIGSAMFALCLAINPEDDMLGHTIGFLAMLLIVPLVWWSYLAQAMACQRNFPDENRHLYGIRSLRFALIILVTIVGWAKFAGTTYALFWGFGQPVKYEVAKILDTLWLVCFFACPYFFPNIHCPALYPNGDIREEEAANVGNSDEDERTLVARG